MDENDFQLLGQAVAETIGAVMPGQGLFIPNAAQRASVSNALRNRASAPSLSPQARGLMQSMALHVRPKGRRLILRKGAQAQGNFNYLGGSVTVDKGAATPVVQATFVWKGPFGGKGFYLLGAPVIDADSIQEWIVTSVLWNGTERLSGSGDVTVTTGTAAGVFSAATTNVVGIPASIFENDSTRAGEYSHLWGGRGQVVAFEGSATLSVTLRNISASTAVEPISIGLPVLVDRCGGNTVVRGSGSLSMADFGNRTAMMALGAVEVGEDELDPSDFLLD